MNIDVRFEDHFLFTQHSLNTFDKCPLKFKKRYLENLKWESLPQENIKKYLEMGKDFHLLAFRYFSGIDDGSEGLYDENHELKMWIDSLVNTFKIRNDIIYLPEYKLRMNSNGLKLEANFDLIMVLDNEIQIWDWKTHGGSEKKRKDYEKIYRESLQTIVYLFVLKEQLNIVAGEELSPDRIIMRYWQPGCIASSEEQCNDQPGCMPSNGAVLAEIRYSEHLHERFRNILNDKVQSILKYDFDAFDKAEYIKHCKFCEFNWFCNNEMVDYDAIEDEVDILSDFDWEAIEEKY